MRCDTMAEQVPKTKRRRCKGLSKLFCSGALYKIPDHSVRSKRNGADGRTRVKREGKGANTSRVCIVESVNSGPVCCGHVFCPTLPTSPPRRAQTAPCLSVLNFNAVRMSEHSSNDGS